MHLDDCDTPGKLLTYYRERRNITRNALARDSGAIAHPSAYIQDFEEGRRTIPKRRIAVAYARVLKLDPWETDHFLFVWGFAPTLDWQSVAEDLMIANGLGDEFRLETAAYYRALAEHTPEEPPGYDFRTPSIPIRTPRRIAASEH
jgi:transcriptional regulator with XRE-family HTH domain